MCASDVQRRRFGCYLHARHASRHQHVGHPHLRPGDLSGLGAEAQHNDLTTSRVGDSLGRTSRGPWTEGAAGSTTSPPYDVILGCNLYAAFYSAQLVVFPFPRTLATALGSVAYLLCLLRVKLKARLRARVF